MMAKTDLKPFKWTLFSQEAAIALGCGRSKEEAREIANCKVVRTIELWLKHPEFLALVESVRGNIANLKRDAAEQGSLADYKTRIAKLDERYSLLQALIHGQAVWVRPVDYEEGDPMPDFMVVDWDGERKRVPVEIAKNIMAELRAIEQSVHRMVQDETKIESNKGTEFLFDLGFGDGPEPEEDSE